MKMLFLDPSPDRVDRFLLNFPSAMTATTPEFAIACLARQKYDVVCIHESKEVAAWIMENMPAIKRIYLHSHNFSALAPMREQLSAVGYPTFAIPFTKLKTFINL